MIKEVEMRELEVIFKHNKDTFKLRDPHYARPVIVNWFEYAKIIKYELNKMESAFEED